MAAGSSPEELLKLLDNVHKNYLETVAKVHEALARQTPSNTPASPSRRRRRSTLDPDAERPLLNQNSKHLAFAASESNFSDDFSDDDDELYVQDALAPYKFDIEDLQDHLKTYKFNEQGKILLESVITESGRLRNPSSLFPQYPPDELYHNSHYTVFDVGKDGAPVSRRKVVESGSTIDSAIWQAIRVRCSEA
jgi:hypothetical protein